MPADERMKSQLSRFGAAWGGCLLLLLAPASQTTKAEVPGGDQADSARISAVVPAQPNARATYVFYLHGRIVEEQGADAISPSFGRYEYRAILTALAHAGHMVISEVRPASSTVQGYARQVARQVQKLMAAGVAADQITLIGASKGGAIALQVSRSLATKNVGYVVLGACNPGATSGGLHGGVLSVREASDPIGTSCKPAFRASPALGVGREIELHTGEQHGFLYKPSADWLNPALAWIDARSRASML